MSIVPRNRCNIGDRYGQWLVIGSFIRNEKGVRKFLCKCDCGVIRYVAVSNLYNSISTNCGCVRRAGLMVRNLKHGDSYAKKTNRLYRAWAAMKTRCTNHNVPQFKDYGGRGIKLAPQWYDYRNFKKWAEANGFKEGLSIERKDVNGNYEPENCCWATSLEQANNKRNSVFLTAFGETKTLTQWARDNRCLISHSGLSVRLRSWTGSIEDMITLPPRAKKT